MLYNRFSSRVLKKFRKCFLNLVEESRILQEKKQTNKQTVLFKHFQMLKDYEIEKKMYDRKENI